MSREPTREVVLAWMRETGKSYTLAAQWFGLNPQVVKGWMRRAPRPTPHAAPHETAKAAVQPRAGKATKGAAESRAPARPPIVEAIGPELRNNLRRGVSGISRFIAQAGDSVRAQADATDSDGSTRPPPTPVDWQQVAQAARALDIIVGRIPDLMTFDERTRDAAPDTTAQDAQIAAAFGTPTATVTVIDGGKATGST